MCENVYDMIIVGSGPAGLTAGVYGKRAGLKVVILESGFIQGGQIVNTYEVDNYPGLPGIGGLELAEKMKEHVTGLGVEREGEGDFTGRRLEGCSHEEGGLSWKGGCSGGGCGASEAGGSRGGRVVRGGSFLLCDL